MNKTKGILGKGFVGAILKKYYPEAKVYDIKGDCDPLEEVLAAKIIFIAINFKDNCRSEENKKTLADYFSQMKDGTVVIIKSTFITGTTDYFQTMFPGLRFVYNCEFLTEMTAWNDFTNPQFQILGCPHESLELVHELFELLPEAPVKRVISPLDAEILKHAINSYYSIKVTYFNQLYDACQKLGSDYETVREIMVQNEWIGNSHSVIWHNGYRGFGGKCLLKDITAFAEVSGSPLLREVLKINETLNVKKM